MEPQLTAIYEAVLEGDQAAVNLLIRTAVEAGVPAKRILNEALIPAMDQVGVLYENGEYYVPEMLIAAQAMRAGLAHLKPLLIGDEVQAIGTVVLATVQGDLHDIGKNLVAMMLEGGGFEVIDLGVDVRPVAFVEAVQAAGSVDIVGLSALLTTTMPSMRRIISALEEAGLRDRVKVIVGGAPVTEEFADSIGADGYATDAGHAVRVVRQLLEPA